MGEINLKAIVCVTTDFCIGRNNDLIYNIKEDLQRFKKLTEGGVVYMGGNTWKSLPKKPLRNRINVVLTDEDAVIESMAGMNNVCVVTSLENMRQCMEAMSDKEQWIIGGASVYAQTLPWVSVVEFTEVQETGCKDDVKFPVLSEAEWDIFDASEILTDEATGVKYKYRRAIRKR